ncbi:hypothetical protein MJT46_009659 [Ovis ammon polii x Ovis aries]|nr:hypothetical protein MJT46_009659 [Ovis ammon polii x Ovis aries]
MAMGSPHPATREQILFFATRESLCTVMKTQGSQNTRLTRLGSSSSSSRCQLYLNKTGGYKHKDIYADTIMALFRDDGTEASEEKTVFMVQLNCNSYGTHCPLVFSRAFLFFGFLHRHFSITKYHYQRVWQDEVHSSHLVSHMLVYTHLPLQGDSLGGLYTSTKANLRFPSPHGTPPLPPPPPQEFAIHWSSPAMEEEAELWAVRPAFLRMPTPTASFSHPP